MYTRKEYLNHNWNYFTVEGLDMRTRVKLHLTKKELHLTDEDWKLLANSTQVNLTELRELIIKGGFKNLDIKEETGLSPAMWSAMFSKHGKTKRNPTMKSVIAILNAIRGRGITVSFDKILI